MKSSRIRPALLAYVCLDDPVPVRVLTKLAGRAAVLKQCWEILWHVPNMAKLLGELDKATKTLCLPPRTSHQRQLDQACLRTAWNRQAIAIFFACRSPVFNGHAHVDPCGFDLCGLGEDLLVDPGRFTYEDNAARRDFKSAQRHNTLTINHRPPFEYISSWRFGPQKQGGITRVQDSASILAAEALHHNFAPTVHRRLVAIIDGRWVLVLDHLDQIKPTSSVQLYYHANSTDMRWNRLAGQAAANCGKVRLTIQVSPGLRGKILPGKISRVPQEAVDSLRLELHENHGGARRCYATALLPSLGKHEIAIQQFNVIEHKDRLICCLGMMDQIYRITWHLAGEQFVEMERLDAEYLRSGELVQTQEKTRA